MAGGSSPELVRETRRFFEDRTGEPVSDGDAAEAIRNCTDLFRLLGQWEEASTGDEEGDHAGEDAP